MAGLELSGEEEGASEEEEESIIRGEKGGGFVGWVGVGVCECLGVSGGRVDLAGFRGEYKRAGTRRLAPSRFFPVKTTIPTTFHSRAFVHKHHPSKQIYPELTGTILQLHYFLSSISSSCLPRKQLLPPRRPPLRPVMRPIRVSSASMLSGPPGSPPSVVYVLVIAALC